MPQDRGRSARRAGVAVLAVVAMLFAGLPTSALADGGAAPAFVNPNGPSTISGRVVLPAGVDASTFLVEVHYFDTADGRWHPAFYADPAADGSFVVTGVATDLEFRLFLFSRDLGFVTGFYAGPDGGFVANGDAGVPVLADSHGWELRPIETVSTSGTLSVPPGFDSSVGTITIFSYESTTDGSTPRNGPTAFVRDGKFTFDHLRPGGHYRFEVRDSLTRFATGYYHSGVAGLVAAFQEATPVLAGSSVHITIASAPVAPRLSVVSAPEVSGDAVVGGALTATPGTWSLFGPTLTYQWLRDGVAVAGATQPGFAVTAADIGSRLSARVTAAKAGYADAVSTSAATAVVPDPNALPPGTPDPEVPGTPDPEVPGTPDPENPGTPGPDAPATLEATVAPRITGGARLGGTLRATAGSWSLPGVKVAYQWLRGGKAIQGATSATYKLKRKDVGKRVSVRVTARLAGHDDGASSSAAKKVAKGKPQVTVKAKKVKASKRAKIVVRVKAAGLAKPTGTVIVKYGKKKIKAKLVAKRKGKVTVRLPKLAKGKYKVTVTFKPNVKSKKFVTKAISKRSTLRVR